jgi:hypothetical protein
MPQKKLKAQNQQKHLKKSKSEVNHKNSMPEKKNKNPLQPTLEPLSSNNHKKTKVKNQPKKTAKTGAVHTLQYYLNNYAIKHTITVELTPKEYENLCKQRLKQNKNNMPLPKNENEPYTSNNDNPNPEQKKKKSRKELLQQNYSPIKSIEKKSKNKAKIKNKKQSKNTKKNPESTIENNYKLEQSVNKSEQFTIHKQKKSAQESSSIATQIQENNDQENKSILKTQVTKAKKMEKPKKAVKDLKNKKKKAQKNKPEFSSKNYEPDNYELEQNENYPYFDETTPPDAQNENNLVDEEFSAYFEQENN